MKLLPAWLCGTCMLRIPKDSRRAVFACLLDCVIFAKRCTAAEDDTILLTLTLPAYRRLLAVSRRRNLELPEPYAYRGLPAVVSRLRTRPGLLAGGICGVLLCLLSSLVVWRVDVICIDNAHTVRTEDLVDTEDVRKRLASFGIREGMFLPGFRAGPAENRYLIGQNDISFMAINRKGTILSVEVRPARQNLEHADGAPVRNEDGTITGCSLTADGDGIIVRTEIRSGTPCVVQNEMVVRGQMLASGIMESQDGDVRYSRASGKVYAKTVRTLTAEIPFAANEPFYTGETGTVCRLSCFGLTVLLPSNVTFLEIFPKRKTNTGIPDAEYDIIRTETAVCLPDGTPLPVRLKKEERKYRSVRPHRLTREEAHARAEASLREQLSGYRDARVLSCEARETETKEALTLVWDVFCIDNIAVPSEFTVRPQEPSAAP